MNCSLNFLEMCLIRCFVVRDVCWSSESSWQFVSPHWRTGTFSWENNDGGHSSLWPHEEMRGFTCQHFLGNDCHDGGETLKTCSDFFKNFILCKTLHRANSPFWVSMQSSTGSVWDWECEVHSYSSQEGSTAYRENWELLGKMCHNEFTMDSHLCK